MSELEAQLAHYHPVQGYPSAFLALFAFSCRTTASGPTSLKCRVKMQEFDAGILGRELPVHGHAQGVAVLHPGLDLGSQHGLAFDALVQALRGQGRELDFGNVEPAAVLGCVVPLQPRRGASRLGRGKGLVEHAGMERVEVVADQDHLLGLREVHVHQVAQDRGKIPLGAPCCDLDRAPALLGRGDHEQVVHSRAPAAAACASPTPAACWSRPRRPPGSGRPGDADRPPAHPPCCAQRRRWPAGGCTSIVSATASTRFWRVRRTVSGAIASTTSRATSSAASSFSVQRARPGGSVEQDSRPGHPGLGIPQVLLHVAVQGGAGFRHRPARPVEQVLNAARIGVAVAFRQLLASGYSPNTVAFIGGTASQNRMMNPRFSLSQNPLTPLSNQPKSLISHRNQQRPMVCNGYGILFQVDRPTKG